MSETELPPLPDADFFIKKYRDGLFTPGSVQRYVMRAVLAERERCAAICERGIATDPEPTFYGHRYAAAIRGG